MTVYLAAWGKANPILTKKDSHILDVMKDLTF